MESRIETVSQKKLVGIRLEMSLARNRTAELWGSFMPRRAQIKNRADQNFISMQVFAGKPTFSPDELFYKWAAVEVNSLEDIPEGMESYLLEGGPYAVFIHNGPASAFLESWQFIFRDWIPTSGHALDSREHFEVLPANYRPDDPNATEEIWIPITMPAT